jgi:hypothetical protein
MKMKRLALTVATVTALSVAAPVWSDARVNVAHFAPFAEDIADTAVDIAVNGEIALTGVEYKAFTDYLNFAPDTYTIDVYVSGLAETSDPVISGEFTLTDNVDYTVYAVGNGSTQDLELRALVDDVDAPMDGNLNIRIVHAAPFAADLAATEVSIRTAGGDLVNNLEGVPYGVDSGFFEIPADTYDLKVASNDGTVNYIDPLPVPLPAGADITVFAVGDGVNQPLGIIAFPVGELETRTPVDNRSNGWWAVTPADAGTGFILQPMPSQNRLVGTWYTYDAEGNPQFLTFDSCMGAAGTDECPMPGGFDGTMATTALYISDRVGVDADAPVNTVQVGEIAYEILSCDEATATVTLEGSDPVEYSATRLTGPFPCADEE